MRVLFGLLLGLFLVSSSARAQTTFILPDTAGMGEVEKTLLQFEQKRSDAIFRHDTVLLRQMYAPEFRGVTATGIEVDVETLLKVFSQDDPRTSFVIDELRAHSLGSEAAWLSGRLTTKDKESGTVRAASRFLHVYRFRDGRWQIVAAQGTLLRAPQ